MVQESRIKKQPIEKSAARDSEVPESDTRRRLQSISNNGVGSSRYETKLSAKNSIDLKRSTNFDRLY